jgi:HAD superfamily hydrolase (TIGR01490 family)
MGGVRCAKVGAFFDVDKTLISENSGTLYLRALYERGDIRWTTVVRSLASYLQYKLNLLDMERWVENAARDVKGRSERALTRESNQWFRDYVLPKVYPEARELTSHHAERGHVVALVSGATKFVLRPLARHLHVKHIMHTHLEVTDGHFTGRVLQPICFGEGKIYWVQQLIEREGIDLAKSYFYSDSITDLPLLELVGHPQVVNPDPLLYREARRRHWPVRFFGS